MPSKKAIEAAELYHEINAEYSACQEEHHWPLRNIIEGYILTALDTATAAILDSHFAGYEEMVGSFNLIKRDLVNVIEAINDRAAGSADILTGCVLKIDDTLTKIKEAK